MLCFLKIIFSFIIGWATLVMALKKSNLLKNTCPYHAAVSNFFHNICVTGPKLDRKITEMYKNIRYCNSERK